VRDFNNINMQAVMKDFFLQDKAPKEIHTILRETLACFLPGRAKDLSAPFQLVMHSNLNTKPVILCLTEQHSEIT